MTAREDIAMVAAIIALAPVAAIYDLCGLVQRTLDEWVGWR